MYLINTLDPKLNRSLIYHRDLERANVPLYTPSQNELCKGFTVNGEKCKLLANTNGFCRYHGGNGITLSVLKEEAMKKVVQNYRRD